MNHLLKKPPTAVSVLAAIATLVASYLAWHSLSSGSNLAGCSGEGAGCSEVLQTRWGSWMGIPVAAGGLVTYAALFLLSLLMRKGATGRQWLAILGISVLAACSGLWFIAVQLLIVKSYCWYCMSVHACGLLIAGLLLKNAPAPSQAGHKKKQQPVAGISLKQRGAAAAAGVLGVIVLAGGQLWSGRVETPAVAPPTAQTQTPPPVTQSPSPVAVSRSALLNRGAFRFEMGEFPIFGSPDAQNIIAHFYDYTCPACREFHASLLAAQQPNENTTALVMIPVPLDAVCNPAVKETSYSHLNACEYARLGLAIWSIRPDVFYMYDEFLFEGQHPPPLPVAKNFAGQLVGPNNLEAALVNPKIDQTMRLGMSMFYSPAFPNKAIPALVTEDSIIVGMQSLPLLNTLFAGKRG